MAIMTFYQFLIALCMGMAAVSFFIWGAMAGQFNDIESIKHQVLEVENDE
tara:strand:+ start:5166 stop:5315 length:150 start_codon:yes stop_codon:yes gene_type:complete